jgi:hypothetical protein
MRYFMVIPGILLAASVLASTTIQYQGQLTNAGIPHDGQVTMSFELFDTDEGGDSIAGPLTPPAIEVREGLFAAELDFGAVFDGSPIYLQITIGGQALLPRHRITASPWAVHALGTTIVAGAGLQADGNQVAIVECPEGQILISQGGGWICAQNSDQGDSNAYIQVDPDGVQVASFHISGTGKSDGMLEAESFMASSPFDEINAPDSYPLGVSWQFGRGSNAPEGSACRFGIVKTMRFSNCRIQQVCFEREGEIRTRSTADVCNPASWGNWRLFEPATPL